MKNILLAGISVMAIAFALQAQAQFEAQIDAQVDAQIGDISAGNNFENQFGWGRDHEGNGRGGWGRGGWDRGPRRPLPPSPHDPGRGYPPDRGDYGRGGIIYCAINDYRYECQEATRQNPRFFALGCVGVVGEGGQPSLSPENINRSNPVGYGYQRRPRRDYNYVNGPVWFYNADSYDWACSYTAIQVR
ncbi:MAG: hypothetical protein ACOYOK_07515 [Pseudobdellovibrionaceae bacterium]